METVLATSVFRFLAAARLHLRDLAAFWRYPAELLRSEWQSTGAVMVLRYSLVLLMLHRPFSAAGAAESCFAAETKECATMPLL